MPSLRHISLSLSYVSLISATAFLANYTANFNLVRDLRPKLLLVSFKTLNLFIYTRLDRVCVFLSASVSLARTVLEA